MKTIVRLVAAATLVLSLQSVRAESDYQWSWSYNGFTSYRLASSSAVSSPDLYDGAFPADDPTLTLQIGKRYAVTNSQNQTHPFQVTAKGASDFALLAQGAAVGSMESDPEVNWVDDGQVVTFTMTQGLLTAMQQNGRSPGYRCGVHTTNMRGDFVVIEGPSPTPSPTDTASPTETPSPTDTPSPTPTPEVSPTPYEGRGFGDFDDSGCTDLDDFLFLLDNWTLDVEGTPIGLDDFLALLDYWFTGPSCP